GEVGLLVATDLDDLADVDAGDPHRRPRPQQRRVLDDGLDLEVMTERDRLGEAEVRHDRGQEQRQQAGAGGGHPGAVVAPHPRSLTVLSTLIVSRASPLPKTWWPLV